jgi:hypothetical protein
MDRRAIVVAGQMGDVERVSSEVSREGKSGELITEEGKQKVMFLRKHDHSTMPWRFSQDLPRAALVAVISGVGYLL